MAEEVYDELSFQLESCVFSLTTMLKDMERLRSRLDEESIEWPEDADIMLSDMQKAIGGADDKVCEIVGQIDKYW